MERAAVDAGPNERARRILRVVAAALTLVALAALVGSAIIAPQQADWNATSFLPLLGQAVLVAVFGVWFHRLRPATRRRR